MFTYNGPSMLLCVIVTSCVVSGVMSKTIPSDVTNDPFDFMNDPLSKMDEKKNIGKGTVKLIKLEPVYSRLTGVVTSIKDDSCKCVSLFDKCDIEMLEETVISVRGRACLKNQRFCCQKQKQNMKVESNLSQLNSIYLNRNQSIDDNTILRDEIFNMVDMNDTVMTSEPTNKEPTNKEPTNKEPTNKEPTNKEPTNKETTNKEPKDENNNNVYIRPATLAAILRLLTEGFKFLSNFF